MTADCVACFLSHAGLLRLGSNARNLTLTQRRVWYGGVERAVLWEPSERQTWEGQGAGAQGYL